MLLRLRLPCKAGTLQRRQVRVIGNVRRRSRLPRRSSQRLTSRRLSGRGLSGLLRGLRRTRRRTGAAGRSTSTSDHTATLQRLDALDQRLDRLLRGRQQHPRAQHLEQQPRRRRTRHVRQPALQHVGETRQRPGGHRRRLLAHRVDAILRGVDQPLLHRIGHRGDDQQVTHAPQQILGEPLRVLPRPHHAINAPEQRRTIGLGQRAHRVIEQALVGHAEQPRGEVVRHALRARTGEQLVHHGQRVTRRTTARSHHQRIHVVGDRHVLLADDALQQPAHQIRRQQPERIVVGARPDGGQHLLRLRGRENENEVLRRLLHDLQQRIEALRRDHVRLVDDEDAVPRLRRRVHRLVAQIAHVVDAVVRRRVELHHVEVARATRPQRHARRALSARRRRRPLHAVEAARQNARRRRLAATARPREQVRMVDPVRGPVRATRFQGRGQGVGHVPLPHDLGKRRWTILPVQSHAPSLPAPPDHRPAAFEQLRLLYDAHRDPIHRPNQKGAGELRPRRMRGADPADPHRPRRASASASRRRARWRGRTRRR